MLVGFFTLYIFVLLFGVIFLAPDIFVSQFYTFQALLSVGGVAYLTLLFLVVKKKLRITLSSIIPIIISIFGVIVYSKSAITDISGLLLLISSIVLICDNIDIYKGYKILYNVLAILATLQMLYGFGQYFNLIQSRGHFDITGTFDNPAGFAICLSMLLSFVLYKDNKESNINWCWKGVVALLSIVIVFLSGSRTGILSIFITVLIWLYNDVSILYFYKKRNIKIKIATIFCVLILLILILYVYKLDSANGRLLIWQVSANLIYDSPIIGLGPNAFSSEYMLAQSEYFSNYSNSAYSFLADNIKHSFNEYITILIEYGLIGMLLLIVYSFFIIRVYKYNASRYKKPAMYSILSFLVVSLTSYPLDYPFVWLLLALSIGIVSNEQKDHFFLPIILRVLLIILIGIFVITPTYQKWIDERKWHIIANLSLIGKTRHVLSQYEELYKRMNSNGLFLYNYGAELAHIGEYEKSNIILKRCESFLNNADVQILIANNYTQLKQYCEAEKRLILAHNMIPNRFVPLYELMKLYDSTMQTEKATNIANQILEKNIKIHSNTILSIRNIARDIIDKNTKLSDL